MSAISLFSGCGGDTLGLERAGFKVIAFNEFKKPAIDTHLLNFPESTLIEDKSKNNDITKIPDEVFVTYKNKVDIVFAGFPCFVAGTRVLTDAGYMSIEDVTLQHKLLTHTGKFQPIINLQKKLYSDSLYEINLKYHPDNIVCTKEHPFYVREKTRIWNSDTRKYEYSYNEPIWKNASQLTEDDYFGMVINNNSIIPEMTVEKKVNASKKSLVTLTLNDPDMWFMMGYFVGDGWIEETTKSTTGNLAHKIRFAVNNKDEAEILERIRKILPITDKKCDSGLAKKFGCADVVWYTILKQFGKYAHGKIIPEWVHDAPTNLIEEFINGYMTADGNIRKDGRHRITTVSYNLAFSLQRLYMKLGHLASIHRTVRPKTCVIECRIVNQRDTYEVEVLLEKKRTTSSFIEGNYMWVASQKITILSATTEPVSVYNFEVANDNSYIIENTVVHNCQGFSNAGKRKATDPRNQMYRQFVRFVKNSQPKFFIGENVTGLTTMKSGPKESDPSMLALIESAFNEIGYSMTYQVLEATDFGVPQKRKRILLVGWRKDLFSSFNTESFWAQVAANGAAKVAPKLRTFVTTSMDGAFRVPSAQVPHDFALYALPVAQNTEPVGTPHPYVSLKAGTTSEEYDGKTHTSLLSCSKRDSPIHSEVVDLDAPSKTIICTYEHQPRLLVGLRKPDGTAYVRALLPDELKQIQGFPADYKLSGSKKDQITQIGNAVPPPMIECIAGALKKLIVLAAPLKFKVKIKRTKNINTLVSSMKI